MQGVTVQEGCEAVSGTCSAVPLRMADAKTFITVKAPNKTKQATI